jgi:hypothetical protein
MLPLDGDVLSKGATPSFSFGSLGEASDLHVLSKFSVFEVKVTPA